MCAAASPSASLSPSMSTGRSLLSRLTTPLRSRTRNLTEFHISPDEPHRQYSPGDLVKGAVVLTAIKPIRITHLTVCLHGSVRVFKHADAANDPLPEPGVAGSSRKSQYFGNGHASLFQDEVTLCGEGRLEAGVYEFNFELEFPTEGLPTSIDFERGSISYLIRATITRPVSIAPTSTCERKIVFVETVDIGPMPPPKARTISLEPIARKSKRRKGAKTKENDAQDTIDTPGGSETTRPIGSPLPDESASQCGSMDQHAAPRSPVPSDVQSTASATTSAEGSTVSGSTGLSYRIGPVPSSGKSTQGSKGSKGSSGKASLEGKTITATIELFKSGALPGDNLPLKVTIKHTKAIKSMHGIIVTLYRQGRIDSAPPLSLFQDTSGKEAEKLKHEEYYPKSKTGLGGLSLSSAGSCSLFRKDLAQSFAPILVDPTTLTTAVNVSVRVPEDVFPTIARVPGHMISFKYHVEVVVDLGGKLAGQQRHLPRVGTAPSSGYGIPANLRGEGNPNFLAAYGTGIVETDNIRREKSVVACVFEVIVGTSDSARHQRRSNNPIGGQTNEWSEDFSTHHIPNHDPIYEGSSARYNRERVYDYHQQYPYHEQPDEEPSYEYPPGRELNYQEDYDMDFPPPAHARVSVPPPEIAAEEGLGEKERARLHEQRLLPSEPPLDSSGSSAPMVDTAPSVPSAPTPWSEEDLYTDDDATPRGVTGAVRSSATTNSHPPTPATAPALEDANPPGSLPPTDDKQELARRRLLAEASAPTDFPVNEEDGGEGQSSNRSQFEPSAPMLTDDDDHYGTHYPHDNLPGSSSAHPESLPRYER